MGPIFVLEGILVDWEMPIWLKRSDRVHLRKKKKNRNLHKSSVFMTSWWWTSLDFQLLDDLYSQLNEWQGISLESKSPLDPSQKEFCCRSGWQWRNLKFHGLGEFPSSGSWGFKRRFSQNLPISPCLILVKAVISFKSQVPVHIASHCQQPVLVHGPCLHTNSETLRHIGIQVILFTYQVIVSGYNNRFPMCLGRSKSTEAAFCSL